MDTLSENAAALTFDGYFLWLIPWEGTVFENDPDDPGGATKYGIDQRSHPEVNIRALTADQAKEIYRRSYWRPVSAGLLPPRTAWAVMDCAVNCGKSRAALWLQTSCGAVPDGWIGQKTIAAAAAADDAVLAGKILRLREDYYRNLGDKTQFRKFLRGWLNRNESLRRALGAGAP